MYKFAVVVLALAATAFADTVVKSALTTPYQTPLAYTAGVHYPQYAQYAQYPQYAQYNGLNAYPYAGYQSAGVYSPYSALPASYSYPVHQQVYQKAAVVAPASTYSGYAAAVPTTYSAALPATYSAAVPTTYSAAVPATYSAAVPATSTYVH